MLYAATALAAVGLPHVFTFVNLRYSLFIKLIACNGEENE